MEGAQQLGGVMGVKGKAFSWSESTNKAVYGVNSFQTSGYAVKSDDLESLQNSLDRWGQFLRNVFLGSARGYINQDSLDQLALEDTELYLDVKIQLSQILSSIQDDILANRLEMICNTIRKNSYQFLTTSLQVLNNNSRQMVEHKNQSGLLKTETNRPLYVNTTGVGAPGTDEEQNEIAVRRKQIMLTINRQHRDVIHHLAQLNKKISNNLYSEEFEF